MCVCAVLTFPHVKNYSVNSLAGPQSTHMIKIILWLFHWKLGIVMGGTVRPLLYMHTIVQSQYADLWLSHESVNELGQPPHKHYLP